MVAFWLISTSEREHLGYLNNKIYWWYIGKIYQPTIFQKDAKKKVKTNTIIFHNNQQKEQLHFKEILTRCLYR
jgi:hypothetical protein